MIGEGTSDKAEIRKPLAWHPARHNLHNHLKPGKRETEQLPNPPPKPPSRSGSTWSDSPIHAGLPWLLRTELCLKGMEEPGDLTLFDWGGYSTAGGGQTWSDLPQPAQLAASNTSQGLHWKSRNILELASRDHVCAGILSVSTLVEVKLASTRQSQWVSRSSHLVSFMVCRACWLSAVYKQCGQVWAGERKLRRLFSQTVYKQWRMAGNVWGSGARLTG
ncbi:hypothetical protein RRG08_031951 [Elysia crispata]|uniref:Uncharacterized protein n=1 Tax=Elysia crispata TaxID=231223 RepID=A0AAE0Z410_9GAST|nr:hypothetical protein RRG08_031951 [Elysia crispata]